MPLFNGVIKLLGCPDVTVKVLACSHGKYGSQGCLLWLQESRPLREWPPPAYGLCLEPSGRECCQTGQREAASPKQELNDKWLHTCH